MAALGIVAGELGISSTKYTALQTLSFPAQGRQRLQHVCSLSTSFPTKELGYVPASLSGVMLRPATGVDTFVAAVLTGTGERRISFLFEGAEVYVYAWSGDITEITYLKPWDTGNSPCRVGFSFPLSRSQLYKASDDSVLWGS